MIEATHLFKRYSGRTVVDDLSLSVREGDVLGFIGPNGAGKTTTMKMLCGIMPVYQGKVSICGIDMSVFPREAKEKIGYLPENAPLPPSMTVASFLRYAAEMRGLTGQEKNAKIQLAVSRCALENVLHEEIEALSKGYKRRVCLAQSILHDPPVLVMDEPTDGLDPNQKREIRSLINRLREHSAIVISTHILEEVEAVCSRVLLICNGKCRFSGTKDDFCCQLNPGETLPDLFARLTADGNGGREG